MTVNTNKYTERILKLNEYDQWGLEYSVFRIELEVQIHQRQGWELVESPYPTRHLRINHNKFNLKEFDPHDGNLLYIGNKVNGKKEGIHILYETNGDIKESFEFKDGIKENEGYEFSKSGHLIIYRFKNGKLHGVCQSFKNHGYDYKRNYINGVLNGKNTHFWDNGNIRDELIYKDGKINKELFLPAETFYGDMPLNLDHKSFDFQDKANFAFALQKETQKNMEKAFTDLINNSGFKQVEVKNIDFEKLYNSKFN